MPTFESHIPVSTNPGSSGESEIEKGESLKKRYASLISKYLKLNRDRKKILRDVERGVVDKLDEQAQFNLEATDSDRHAVHLQLEDLGSQFGKKGEDVLVDIIRQQNSLEGFGLPELSLLNAEDVRVGDWHNPYYFNVNTKALKPSDVSSRPRLLGVEQFGFETNEVMLVYGIVPYRFDKNHEHDNPQPHLPKDLDDRIKKAKELSLDTNGRLFDQVDSEYHEAEARIIGVIVSKKELETTLSLIRDNPQKYRIGF